MWQAGDTILYCTVMLMTDRGQRTPDKWGELDISDISCPLEIGSVSCQRYIGVRDDERQLP